MPGTFLGAGIQQWAKLTKNHGLSGPPVPHGARQRNKGTNRSESDTSDVIALYPAVALKCPGLQDTFTLLEIMEIPEEFLFRSMIPIDIYRIKT